MSRDSWIRSLPPPRGVAKRRADKWGYDTGAFGTLPGVTTVLGATSEGKERLKAWKERPGAAAASDAAKARGTWTHSCIEEWILAHAAGAPPPDPRHMFFGGYWRNIRPWLEAHWLHATALEQAVFHPAGMAGSFDALGYVAYGHNPDGLTLCDWKTSQNPRGVVGHNDITNTLLLDYFDQLGAYSLCLDYVYGVQPERALLVIARPHGSCPDVWELSYDELQQASERFRERLRRYYATEYSPPTPEHDGPSTPPHSDLPPLAEPQPCGGSNVHAAGDDPGPSSGEAPGSAAG